MSTHFTIKATHFHGATGTATRMYNSPKVTIFRKPDSNTSIAFRNEGKGRLDYLNMGRLKELVIENSTGHTTERFSIDKEKYIDSYLPTFKDALEMIKGVPNLEGVVTNSITIDLRWLRQWMASLRLGRAEQLRVVNAIMETMDRVSEIPVGSPLDYNGVFGGNAACGTRWTLTLLGINTCYSGVPEPTNRSEYLAKPRVTLKSIIEGEHPDMREQVDKEVLDYIVENFKVPTHIVSDEVYRDIKGFEDGACSFAGRCIVNAKDINMARAKAYVGNKTYLRLMRKDITEMRDFLTK